MEELDNPGEVRQPTFNSTADQCFSLNCHDCAGSLTEDCCSCLQYYFDKETSQLYLYHNGTGAPPGKRGYFSTSRLPVDCVWFHWPS